MVPCDTGTGSPELLSDEWDQSMLSIVGVDDSRITYYTDNDRIADYVTVRLRDGDTLIINGLEPNHVIRIEEDIPGEFEDEFSSTGESAWLPEYRGLEWGTKECYLGNPIDVGMDESLRSLCSLFQIVKNSLHDVHYLRVGAINSVDYAKLYADESGKFEFWGSPVL